MGVKFDVHHNNSFYGRHEETYCGTVDTEEKSVWTRGLDAMAPMRGESSPSYQSRYTGHYSESNGEVRVYKDHIENEVSLVGHVNKAGQFFNKSGRLLGSVDQDGRISNDKGMEKARLRLQKEQGETPDSELLKKVGGVAGLLLVIASC